MNEQELEELLEMIRRDEEINIDEREIREVGTNPKIYRKLLKGEKIA